MRRTDGIGCSILLIKTKDGKPINITPKIQREYENNMNNQDKYIEDI